MSRKPRRPAPKPTPNPTPAPASTSEPQPSGAAAVLGEWATTGLAHHRAGRLAEAESCYRRILDAAPDHPAILHLLGVLVLQTGQAEEAVRLMGRAIALDPGLAEAHGNLGSAFYALARFEDAEASLRRAIALRPDNAKAHLNLGNALGALGRHEEAAAVYRQAMALAPDLVEAPSNLGSALRVLGRLDDAIDAHRKAIAINPRFAEAHANLGLTLADRGRFNEAVAAYRQAIALKPNIASTHGNLANALREQGRFDEAAAAYRHAIALDPDWVDLYSGLGNVLKNQGRIDEAAAYYNLFRLRRVDPDSPHLAALDRLVGAAEGLAPPERILLHFARGKANDDLGRHPQALDDFLVGNALQRRRIDYREAEELALFRRIKQSFTAEVLAAAGDRGEPSPVPVFVLGMPRSGSTLVEQILASHPQVHGAGELTDLERLVLGMGEASARRFPEDMVVLNDNLRQAWDEAI